MKWVKFDGSNVIHVVDEARWADRTACLGYYTLPDDTVLSTSALPPEGYVLCEACLRVAQIQVTPRQSPAIRTFETGATRDSDDGKYDYEGFLSPLVLERFAAYMHQHRKMADGSMRASDNWQAGMPLAVLVKSAWRHFFAWWKIHRGGTVLDERDGHEVTVDEAICGVLFNAMGYLHETIKAKTCCQVPPGDDSIG